MTVRAKNNTLPRFSWASAGRLRCQVLIIGALTVAPTRAIEKFSMLELGSALKETTLKSERTWDSQRGARDAMQVRGSIPLSTCDRLWDLLADRAGELHYEVQGFIDARGRPGLHLHVWGTVHARCRRCLEPLAAQLDSQRDIVMAPGASEFEQDREEDDTTDLIPLTPKLDLWALAEEEAVLSMPLAACHADGECKSALELAGDARERSSAFAALAKVKGT